MIDNFVPNTSKSSIISKHCLFGSAIARLKTIQTLQVGGVLESPGPPLHEKKFLDTKVELGGAGVNIAFFVKKNMLF